VLVCIQYICVYVGLYVVKIYYLLKMMMNVKKTMEDVIKSVTTLLEATDAPAMKDIGWILMASLAVVKSYTLIMHKSSMLFQNYQVDVYHPVYFVCVCVHARMCA